MDANDIELNDTEHSPGTVTVDCGECVMRHTAACDDCLVTYICDREPNDAVVISLDELRTIKVLSEAGLVPSLKHRSRTG